jgi:hypothetical protein
VIREQVIGETEFEIQVRALMNEMPALQTFFVDDLEIYAFEFLIYPFDLSGVVG